MKSFKIGIIGMGYVGLPLALELGKKFRVIGYDKKKIRVKDLKNKIDQNNEHSKIEFFNKNVKFTNNELDLKECNFYIVCVPTPVTKNLKPDLRPIKSACDIVSKYINFNETVVFESTVYPGLIEEYCVKIIEKKSKIPMSNNKISGFHVGYSPERVNPGDKVHTLKNIKKVISSNSKQGEKNIKNIYSKIIKSGIFIAKSIKVAETAKVLENVQRDVNIALMNELSSVCNLLKINTYDVLNAASTKWNFLRFYPGFVGGHCVSVDPYYLIYKSKKIGHEPKLIISARKINSSMIKILKKRLSKFIKLKNRKILIMGATFKENCADFRNSLSIKLAKELDIENDIYLYDPYFNSKRNFKN